MVWSTTCTNFNHGRAALDRLTAFIPLTTEYQVHAKILSADWSPDGLHLALGFFDGHVGIRDVDGVEKVTISRYVSHNVCSLPFPGCCCSSLLLRVATFSYLVTLDLLCAMCLFAPSKLLPEVLLYVGLTILPLVGNAASVEMWEIQRHKAHRHG